MWYVIQVKSGQEHDLKLLLESVKEPGAFGESFVPLFEDVKRREGKCTIGFRRLFPGYIFVEADDPRKIFETLRGIPDFTKLLGTVEEDGTKLFIPIGKEDEEFLRTLFKDGIMHVSYIHMAKTGRIDRIAGPLANYKNHITKLEMRHRMAIVEAEMFGKKRRVKFGLWTDEDTSLPQVEKLKEELFGTGEGSFSRKGSGKGGDVLGDTVILDLGIHPGDKVMDESGVYGNQIFVVEKVDTKHRTLISTFEMFGTSARIELNADDVRKV